MGSAENAVSKATVSRMPSYLRYLKGEAGKGVQYVSSSAIATALGVSAVGVRKDLALVSSQPGKPRFGFEVVRLIEDIEKFLGYHRWANAVIIGAAVGQWAYHMGKARRAQKQAQPASQTPTQDMPASDELLSPADMPLSDKIQPSHSMSADSVSPLEQDSLPAGMPVSDGMTPSADMPPADADPSAEHVPSIADMSPSNELPPNTDTPPSEEKASNAKLSSSERTDLRKKNNQ